MGLLLSVACSNSGQLTATGGTGGKATGGVAGAISGAAGMATGGAAGAISGAAGMAIGGAAGTGCGTLPLPDGSVGPIRDAPVARRAAPRIDVNGDGFDDILVGTGYSLPAKVEVFLGSATGLGTVPASILIDPVTGSDQVAYSWFGNVFASAGDVNGDGYTDIVVAAQSPRIGVEPMPTGFPGAVFVYLGSATGVPALPSMEIDSPYVPPLTSPRTADTDFGHSVATAGDVNGDGFADVIVGAPMAESGTGRAYLYFGSAHGLAPTPSVTLQAPCSGRQFGEKVRSAGDVNGDGFDDVLVETMFGDQGEVGIVHLFLGSPTGPTSPATLVGMGDGAHWFGSLLAGALDFNGDGYNDVLIVAEDEQVVNTESVRLFLGGPTGLVSASTVTAPRSDEYFGIDIAGVGDLNGDGYGDFIVGATSQPEPADSDHVYVYLGNAAGRIGEAAMALAPPAGGTIGYAMAGAGDLDGDGHPDVILGDYYTTDQNGRVYVYPGGRPDGLGPTPILTLTGTAADYFGYRLGFSK